jgi:hypothetical protein
MFNRPKSVAGKRAKSSISIFVSVPTNNCGQVYGTRDASKTQSGLIRSWSPLRPPVSAIDLLRGPSLRTPMMWTAYLVL